MSSGLVLLVATVAIIEALFATIMAVEVRRVRRREDALLDRLAARSLAELRAVWRADGDQKNEPQRRRRFVRDDTGLIEIEVGDEDAD